MTLTTPARPSTSTVATTDDALQQLTTQLMAASNNAAIATACQGFASAWAPNAQVRWERAGSADKASANAGLTLAEDPVTHARLQLTNAAGQPAAADKPWPWVAQLAQQRVAQLVELHNLIEAVARLAQAERVQRALFTIADLSAKPQDLAAMLRGVQATISTLMYAENFYVALYDAGNDSIRFPYFIDTREATVPDPDTVVPFASTRHSLTWYLIRLNRPLMGTMEDIGTQIDGPLELGGPPALDWLGVPLRSGEIITGALVVQSYRPDVHFTSRDRDLLTFVAQHIQVALERRHRRLEMENTMAERTQALRDANLVLRQQVQERQRGERLQAALSRIAALATSSESLDTFYAAVHHIISSLIYARNFYIALMDEERQLLTFPYSVDEVDTARQPRAHGHGHTEYVLRQGTPLLADTARTRELVEQGEITATGSPAVCWLGVPLIWGHKVQGVMAVQSYNVEHSYERRDQELLTFVSYHIATALQRRQSTEALHTAYTDLEQRVAERTRALALANRDLRAQMSERERIERRLKYETLHDQLTGLPNRTLLLQRLARAMERYQADPKNLFAVLFVDLDRFKVINDSVGHLVGDELLFQVGGRIRASLKTRDTVARLGGDEFAALLDNIRDQDVPNVVAERILASLHEPFRIGVKELFTSASIGITLASPDYRHAEELLRDADSAMYSAKSGGRHRAETFDHQLRHKAMEVLQTESDLRRGLTRHEFMPYYQPIVRLSDRVTVGYEALLRWRHPSRGIMLPADFLGIAEDSGLIEDIDWQIFEQAIAQAAIVAEKNQFVSINLSARHLMSPDLVRRLLALTNRDQLPPKSLSLEVTEGTLLRDPELTRKTLQTFRSRGMRIALDDFGTGYSSLSYMHQYPVDVLKIDQSFVADLDDTSGNHSVAVVKAIRALATSLDVEVIAEGIETTTQERLVRELGCQFGQGFLYSRAIPTANWQADANSPPIPSPTNSTRP